eukprot:366029-Chlamydomonas_euryale.AAC.36
MRQLLSRRGSHCRGVDPHGLQHFTQTRLGLLFHLLSDTGQTLAACSTYIIAGCMGCMHDTESQAALAGRHDCPAERPTGPALDPKLRAADP